MAVEGSIPGAAAGVTFRRAGIPQGLIVALAGFFPVMAIVSLAPAVPTLLHHFRDVPAAHTLVPLIVTAPGLMIALLAPFVGWAADRFGRRRLILGATLLYGIFGSLPFLASSLPTIFASRFALGAAEAAILTLTNVLIADYFDANGRRLWLTVQSVLGPVLGVATITASGMLTSHWWNGAFLIYLVALPMFVLMVPTLFEPVRANEPAQAQAGDPEEGGFPWRAVARYVPFTLFVAILYYVFIVQGGLAFEAIGLADASHLGGLLALASLGVPVGGLLFGFTSRRLPIGLVLAMMLAIMGAGMVGIGLARTIALMVAASFVQQIGAGMCVASLIYWVSGLLPPTHRGRGFGLWSSAFFLGQFLSPALVGPIASGLGSVQAMFVLTGGAGLLVALVAALLRRRLEAVAL